MLSLVPHYTLDQPTSIRTTIEFQSITYPASKARRNQNERYKNVLSYTNSYNNATATNLIEKKKPKY
jgi:hypothetical protein